jgi:hypothetical protein
MAGPFDDLPPRAFTALGLVLVVISAFDVIAGVLLWRGRRPGAQIGLGTDPVVFVLGLGFAMPFLLIGVVVRAVLTLGTWQRLR